LFRGDARPMHAALAAHAACHFLRARRHLGAQTFAQRLDQGIYGEVIA